MTATVKSEVCDEVLRQSEVRKDEITFDAIDTCKRTRRIICDDMPLGKGKPGAANRIARQVLRFLREQGYQI